MVAYLRDVGRFISSEELADDMGISKEHTVRLLGRLIEAGRVVRVQFDNDAALFCLVDGRRKSMKASPCFVRRKGSACA